MWIKEQQDEMSTMEIQGGCVCVSESVFVLRMHARVILPSPQILPFLKLQQQQQQQRYYGNGNQAVTLGITLSQAEGS